MVIERSREKILSIQILRFLAAFIVAYSHIAFGFARYIGEQRGLPFDPPAIALSRVALFFLISGAVMVAASGRLYRQRGAWRTFLQRRIVRILPAYWLATFLFAGWKMFIGQAFDWGEVLLSLFLVPYWSGDEVGHPLPFLWPAWTLFYEAIFYALFAAALFQPRARAVALVTGLLLALVALGPLVDDGNPVLFTITRPILLLFVPGMILGLLLVGNVRIAAPARWLAFATALALILFFPAFSKGVGAEPLGWRASLGIATPATLLALAVMGGPLTIPFRGAVEHLGDMSYSIFLLHVPIVSFWIWFYQKAMPSPGPWGFLASCLVLTLIASHVSYRWFERPLTDWLNSRLQRPAPGDAVLQRTGV